LNLGESLSPVLIAKVQHGAPHPQNVLERFTNPSDESDEEFNTDFASGFESEDEESTEKGALMGDIEWVAFEVFQDDEEEEDDEEEDDEDEDSEPDAGEALSNAMSTLKLDSPSTVSPLFPTGILMLQHQHSSLSLLEYLLRLTALQTFEQQSHMNLTDEHIVLFLRDDNPSSRQQPTIEERNLRRQSSQTSVSSDFSPRAHQTQFPISPPHSDEREPRRGVTTIISSSPIPSERPAEKPADGNPRIHLERAMAADYGPMTLVTPISNRTRNKNNNNRKNVSAKNSASDPRNSNSAPNSLQKNFPVPRADNTSPLVGNGGIFPVRRATSGRRKTRIPSKGGD
jgi:hypothetical protein